jgi:O-succinylbenzoate synthase
MRIEALILRELTMRLRAPFETSFGATCERRIVLVEARADGLCGWGEITVSEDPFYNSECTDTSWVVFSKFLVPPVLGKTITAAAASAELMKSVRGHEMTKAGLENALWDIEAQQKGVSLAKLLGGTHREIACGVSLGIQSQPEKLLAMIDKELAAGYQRIKVKIKAGKDVAVLAAVRERYPHIKLMADANSDYRLEDAAHLKQLDDFNLMMIEQPLAWDDIYEHAVLQAQLHTPICLDECIHNSRHAEAAIRLDACRVINVKLGRVGGHGEARRVHDVAVRNSVPVWCGGMLESGVGRAHNIAMSALPGFVLPGDVSASQRYWDADIIEPEVEVTSGGTIPVPDGAGLGYRVRRERIEKLTVRSETWRVSKVM